MQTNRFHYPQDAFFQPHSQNTAFRRPAFQQPYGRPPLGPVWSNLQPMQHHQNSTTVNEHAFSSTYHNTQMPYQQHVQDTFHKTTNKKIFIQESSKKIGKGFFEQVIDLFQKQGLSAFERHWIKEELNFSMNKISVAGLFFGLMFLGSLFFLIGFLVAVNLYGHKPAPSVISHQRSVMPTQGAILSGKTNQMMDATSYPSSMMNQQIPQNNSLTQGARLPSSMQKPVGLASSLQKQQRIPSFQVSGR